MLGDELKVLYGEQAKEKQREAGKNFGKGMEKNSLHAQGAQPIKRYPETNDEVGKELGVSGDSIRRAGKVKKMGTLELMHKVMTGEISVKPAEQISRLPKEDQNRILEKPKEVITKVATAIPIVEKIKKESPEVAEKVLEKIIEGDAKNTEDALRKVFLESEDRMEEANEKTMRLINRRTKEANGGCLMPNQIKMWCKDCKWGFDIFLPQPDEVKYCPYCGKSNIENRDKEWYPGIEEDI